MALSDVLYPGNREKREQIIRRSQELLELMKNNFRATNDLIKIVNQHMNTSFTAIELDEKATVKENCDVMIERVHEIQAEVEKIDEELKKKLEPSLYEKLKDLSLGVPDYNTVKAVSIVCDISAVLVIYLIRNTSILKNITSTCAKFAGGPFALIVFGVLVDMIISAILGYFERDDLEKTLKEYETALAEFRPASEKYQDAITEVRVMLKCSKK